MMADQAKKRGRPVGTGRGINPEVRERVHPDLAAYCKEQQAISPGFLASLVEAHRIDAARRYPQTEGESKDALCKMQKLPG